MAEPTLEYLRRHLDAESQSTSLLPLPNDFYSKLAAYSQKLKRASTSGASDASVRLIAAQLRMVESMSRALLGLRMSKATQQGALLQLLPEERYVCSARQKFDRRLDSMVRAVSQGQPSFVALAHRRESERNLTVRFVRKVNELVGLDLKRYGPFEADDVASLPAASADILISGGDAVEVRTSDDA